MIILKSYLFDMRVKWNYNYLVVGFFFTFLHFDQFGRLYPIHLFPILFIFIFIFILFFFFLFYFLFLFLNLGFFFFLSNLTCYTFCHTQFFTPLSTSAPLLSVMLISFILLAFSSSFFLCILLLEFTIACCLYQIVPFEEKLEFLKHWVFFFFPITFFPVSPIGCWVTSPCFLHIITCHGFFTCDPLDSTL